MYFVLYDRNFKTIGSTYKIEKWERTKRAVDFDSMRIVGEQIPYTANPFFVVINDKQGKMIFSGLASTPQIDDVKKKTSIILKDYMTLMNSEIIFDCTKSDLESVNAYLTALFNQWISQVNVGIDNIEINTFDIANMAIDRTVFVAGKESVKVYDLFINAINFYNLYCESDLDVYNKKLTFTIKKAGTKQTELKLADFGIHSLEKSFGEYNRVTVYDSAYNKLQEWALSEDNDIFKLPVNNNIIPFPYKDGGPGAKLNKMGIVWTVNSDKSITVRQDYPGSQYDFYFFEGHMKLVPGRTYILKAPGKQGMVTKFVINDTKDIIQNTPYTAKVGDEITLISNVIYGPPLGDPVTFTPELTFEYSLTYPAKNKNFISSNDDSKAVYDAVTSLAGNRYQENIDIDAAQYRNVIDLKDISFAYNISVYTDDGYYKNLPVGEIETNSDGKFIVRLGHRIQELTQEL